MSAQDDISEAHAATSESIEALAKMLAQNPMPHTHRGSDPCVACDAGKAMEQAMEKAKAAREKLAERLRKE